MISTESFSDRLAGARSLLTGVHGIEPRQEYLFVEVTLLALIGAAAVLSFRSLNKKNANNLIHTLGVRWQKVAKATKEIERKTFHLCGLLVPLSYFLSTRLLGYTEEEYLRFCWKVTFCVWGGDIFRVMYPKSIESFPYSLLKGIIRDKEREALSGTCYFSLGCTMAISLYPPSVAITSICWLVLGDMSAALFGVSFGGEACTVKMGREGKKSLEGSVAMFVTCTIVGLVFFAGVKLSDYAVVVGALAATFVELHEPFGLNDNISIPLVSGAVLQAALARVESC